MTGTIEMPAVLAEIVGLFRGMGPTERRDLLVAYAERSRAFGPDPVADYEVSDIRHDEGCTDEVGIFVGRDSDGGLVVRTSLGANVQTLTRAMAGILCEGLTGADPASVAALDRGFVTEIVGEQLVRARSMTVFYMLDRISEATGKLLERQEGVRP